MSLFLSKIPLKLKNPTQISGEEALHMLTSRRIKIGEEVKMQDNFGNRFLCQVTEVNKKTLTLLPIHSLPTPPNTKTPITLYQSYIAEQALDFVLQKATELNIAHIVIFNAHNSPTTPKDIDKKLTRWNKIILESTKQCERATLPTLSFTNSLQESLKIHTPQKLFLLDQAGNTPKITKEIKSAGLIVGPEGGLTQAEISTIKADKICLGPLVLRSETASLAGIATLNHSLGN
jgi:16S rRNA (uracil1498-N3)-methyltransferase